MSHLPTVARDLAEYFLILLLSVVLSLRAVSDSLSTRETNSRATVLRWAALRKPRMVCGSASLGRTWRSSVRAWVRAGTTERKPVVSLSKPVSLPGLGLRAECRRTSTDWLLRPWISKIKIIYHCKITTVSYWLSKFIMWI